MFPLDSNLLIGILIATAILVYVSILRKLRPEKILANMTSEKDSTRQEPREEEPKEKNEEDKSVPKEKERLEEKKAKIRRKKNGKLGESKSSSLACSHEFGYLGTLPKNASIPDECLGCPQIIECLAQK